MPGIIFVNHYNDGFVSFDYPYDSTVSPGINESGLIGTDNSADNGGIIAQVSNGVQVNNGGYTVYIYMSPINQTENVPVAQTVNQTVGLSSNGSAIVAPVNEGTYDQNENVNVLQTALDNYANVTGNPPNQSSNNGFTDYNIGSGRSLSNYVNTTEAATIIAKNGTPYFFIVYLSINEPVGGLNDTAGYNTYNKIIDTFKLG